MNIIKIMIPKINVAYVHADDSMRQGLEKMRRHGYTTVPVISKEGVCVGTVSEGDYLWYMVENGFPDMRRLEEVGISAIINTTRNPAVTIDVSPIELYSRITECTFVPITDDRGCFVGIVTRRAVLSYFRDKLSEYIADADVGD